MDNQDQQNQLSPPQEIDLVDLVAVLYRRRVPLFIVAALCIAAPIAYWSSIEENSEITMSFETGRNGHELIMPAEESHMMLISLILPKHMATLDLSGVTIEHGKSFTSGIVTISALMPNEKIFEKTKSAINSSFDDLLVIHNKISVRYLKAKENLLTSKKHEQEATKVLAISPGHTAVDLATQHILESTIVSTQNLIDLSFPSQISNITTTISIPKISVFIIAFAGLIVGIFVGCGLVFFLELLSQVKSRVAETN